ncbi:tRNA pseudouridine(38-40) synthase TruA [Terriglobus sp.]|uniref:tRNA pseudouridine(38-40) synthase TruA n=1 Tax=Terriglobus sp. TaxID=1889013 RepID=UPI003B005AD7
MSAIDAEVPNGREIRQGRAPRTWRLLLRYDGSDFHGWQVQPGLRTVQGELQRVLRKVVGETVLPQGSGRTDSGVHADGQVVSVRLQAAIPPERLLRALNRKLPGSVRVMSAEIAADSFHARGDVAWKLYTYRIFQRRLPSDAAERICPPLLARAVWDCHWPLLLSRMRQAEADVVGTHDFTSFAASDPDASARRAMEAASTVRTIFTSEWTEENGLLVYRVAGGGFLHHMVRNLVGTFVEIGTGRRPGGSLPGVLAARDRAAAGITAPPQGLSLTRVVYRGEVDGDRYAKTSAEVIA